MAYVEFWGGIGSSTVLIGDGGYRVLLDPGPDIPRERGLSRAGAAAAVPGFFDPAALSLRGGAHSGPLAALAEPAEPAAVFVSHPHVGHVGLAGFVLPQIGVHAAAETIGLLRALAAGGDVLPGPRDFSAPATAWRPAGDGVPVRVGPMTVRRLDVDHDVPGSSGFVVTTSDGVLAFTGDIRFHGRHPERSWAFAEAVAGCDILVTEGATLGRDAARPARAEADVARDYAAALAASTDLMLQVIDPRDLDRVRACAAAAAQSGRVIRWPRRTASFLRAAGIEAVATDLDAIWDNPGGQVVQVDHADLPSLLDLPLGPGSALLHANGEPFGPFDPRWRLFTEWLAHFGLPLRQIGCSGHAYPDDLREMVRRIRPGIVVPVHTRAPDRLDSPDGTRRVLAARGHRYDFAGRARPQE